MLRSECWRLVSATASSGCVFIKAGVSKGVAGLKAVETGLLANFAVVRVSWRGIGGSAYNGQREMVPFIGTTVTLVP